MTFAHRFRALFRADHRAYQEAYSKYEGYVWSLGLTLLGPSASQVAMAREAFVITELDALYDRALESSKLAGIPYNVACVLYQKGLLRRLVGNYRAAEGSFRQALSAFDAVLPQHASARTSISMCHFYLGQALLRMGDRKGAKEHLKTAISLDRIIGDATRLDAVERMLSECSPQASQ
jgi:tetratricopeptide (TPR) repeat protein